MWVFCYSQGPLYTFSDLTFITAVCSPSLSSPRQEESRRGAEHASWIVLVTSPNFIYVHTISCNSFKSTLMWGLLVCLYVFTRETRPAFKERTRTRRLYALACWTPMCSCSRRILPVVVVCSPGTTPSVCRKGFVSVLLPEARASLGGTFGQYSRCSRLMRSGVDASPTVPPALKSCCGDVERCELMPLFPKADILLLLPMCNQLPLTAHPSPQWHPPKSVHFASAPGNCRPGDWGFPSHPLCHSAYFVLFSKM